MLKHDYILRLVEQLAKVLRRLLKKAEECPASVATETDAALRTLAGLDLATVRSLPLPALLELMRHGTEIDPGRTLAVAELLNLQGRADSDAGDEALARHEKVRALALYAEAFLRFRDDAVGASIARAERLIDELRGEPMPVDIQTRLLRYFEATGRFSRAEDVLFDLADEDRDTALALGVAFFQRLLRLDDDVLRAGGLPRDEVQAGLAELTEAANV